MLRDVDWIFIGFITIGISSFIAGFVHTATTPAKPNEPILNELSALGISSEQQLAALASLMRRKRRRSMYIALALGIFLWLFGGIYAAIDAFSDTYVAAHVIAFELFFLAIGCLTTLVFFAMFGALNSSTARSIRLRILLDAKEAAAKEAATPTPPLLT